ncbi:MAG TPA: PKD domain-containing protein [Solirubrobacteraceae bacterium]|nr:PKD domain-containing protein [Solirubrobacteraceae bacterium]
MLTACALVLAAAAAQASAAPYGELLRFGKAGNKAGQFEFNSKEHALGVDPTDNSVYVGDQVKEGNKQTEYRIQKFSATGALVASVSFAVENEAGEGGAPDGIEGIAVDPSLGRVYALVIYERLEEEGPKGLIRLDPEWDAAGILYAFSTTPSAGKLVAAEGTTGGVLASKEALHAQAEVTGKPTESPLLEPAGIAVDPKTHDVIVLGLEDQGEEEMLVAAQRVHSTGALGLRWVDTTHCFEGEPASPGCPTEPEEEPLSIGAEPDSPVVLANGKVLVAELSSEVWEIPSSFVSGQAPRKILAFEVPEQELLEFPGGIVPREGGAMSYVQDKGEGESEGRLYVYAGVKRLNGRTPGVISFKVGEAGGTPTLTELGWTGGANKSEGAGCTISNQTQAMVSAGTGETVFVFDPSLPTTFEEQTEGATTNPHVDKFGPGGSACPVASASKNGLQGNQSGTPVGTEASPIEAGKKVTLSLGLLGGNVRKTEWDFGDGSKGESGYQFGTAHIEHAYTAPGKHEVTVTITTDVLASPTVSLKAPVVVKTATPTAQFSGPGEANVNQKVTFDAKGSVDPNGKALKYSWKFGDGTETTTTSSSIQHEYTAVNTYSVTLTVSDEVATSSPTTHTIKIVAPGGGGGGGGGEEGGGGGTTGGGGGTTGGGTTTGGGGVLGKTEVKGNPEAKLAGNSLSVTPAGSFTVKISCPTGESSCVGTITLRTIGAVSAAKKKKATVLTLASGSFTVAGGASKSLTLHLSSAAKKMLARMHLLRAKATLVAHDSTGATHTTLATVTLKAAKAKHR